MKGYFDETNVSEKTHEAKKFLPIYDEVCMKAGGYFDEMNISEKSHGAKKALPMYDKVLRIKQLFGCVGNEKGLCHASMMQI